MRSRAEGARRRRRAWALAAAVAAASLLPGCYGYDGDVSVGVGVVGPAPWGGVTVAGAVPVGPYFGGRYGRMW